MLNANDFAIALEKASQEVIRLDFAKLTEDQLALYNSRRIPEHNAWVELIKARDSEIRAEAFRWAEEKAWPLLRQEYEWRHEDSECGGDEISEGLDMLRGRLHAAILANTEPKP